MNDPFYESNKSEETDHKPFFHVEWKCTFGSR
jgi:hypothetical protein